MLRLLTFLLCTCAVSASSLDADTVVVLPFFNQSSSANLDWISESISNTISEALVTRGVLVLEREDRAEVYRRLSIRPGAHLTLASALKVAEGLDASDLVFGHFEFTPAGADAEGTRGMLRVFARTVDMTRMHAGQEFSESGPLEDLATIQWRMAWRVLSALAPDLAPTLDEFMQEKPKIRLDALENYMRGLVAPSTEQKHRYFTQAVRLDQRFTTPCFELGKLSFSNKEYAVAADWLSRVKPASARYMEARFFLGLSRLYLGDDGAAQAAFAQVAESVPLNEVLNNLGVAQSRQGQPQAIETFRKALEGDAADPDYRFNLGYALWKKGDFDQAADSFRAALDRQPDDVQATMMLGRCLKRAGPRTAESKTENLERIKLNYEEGAYRQLKAALERKHVAEPGP